MVKFFSTFKPNNPVFFWKGESDDFENAFDEPVCSSDIQSAFETLDANGDQIITYKEFKQVFEKLGFEDDVDEVFEALDRSKLTPLFLLLSISTVRKVLLHYFKTFDFFL